MYQSGQGDSAAAAKQERLKDLSHRIEELTGMDGEAAQNGDFDELFESLYAEMYAIKDELAGSEKTQSLLSIADNQIEEAAAVMHGLKNTLWNTMTKSSGSSSTVSR